MLLPRNVKFLYSHIEYNEKIDMIEKIAQIPEF